MRTASIVQCTVAGLAFMIAPAVAAAPGPAPARATAGAADLWEEFLQACLEHLLRILACDEPTDRSAAGMIKQVTGCYYQYGIPAAANLGEGRAVIRDLYGHVRDDQGALDPDLRQRFMQDLLVMYADFGGDPAELLDPSAGAPSSGAIY